jgi:SAM-dependent methyltransferase
LLARARLIGLSNGASRALEFPCGVGATTAAIAHSLGQAVGVDPSTTSIESAALMHRGDARCTFVTGGLEVVEALTGTFDFAYADLRRHGGTDRPGTVAATLLRALAPGGILVVSLRPLRGVGHLLATACPSRHPINAVRAAVAAAGGRLAWIGRGEGGSLLLYAAAPRRVLYLVDDTRQKVGLEDNTTGSRRSPEQQSPRTGDAVAPAPTYGAATSYTP